jgi:hypothetical protein
MGASIIPFPDRRASSHNSTLHYRRSAHGGKTMPLSSQDQAIRIVAQIEREIANRAYNHAQLHDTAAAPAAVLRLEATAGFAARILHAIKSFVHPVQNI